MADRSKFFFLDKRNRVVCYPVAGLMELRGLFDRIDVDRSGTLDFETFESFARKMKCTALGNSLAIVALFPEIHPWHQGVFLHRLKTMLRQRGPLTFADFLRLGHPEASGRVLQQLQEVVHELVDRRDNASLRAAKQHARKFLKEEERRQAAWVDKMWERWDVDGTGVVHQQDFKLALQNIGASVEEADVFIAEMDHNEGNVISKENFSAWWSNTYLLENPSILHSCA
eukprot:gene15218-18001_t